MDSKNLKSNMSDQALLNSNSQGISSVPSSRSISSEESGDHKPEIVPVYSERKFTRSQLMTVAILCFVNLINYMDRFTVAGILSDVQCFYGIDDSQGGLIQTVFIIAYMVFAPIFGYMGDRYSRRLIMAVGVAFWTVAALVSSFIPQEHFYWFLIMRCLIGIGEASYSTIAPTIISDLFVDDLRSKMLALFYFAIPVGSGLGYIVGTFPKTTLGVEWQWGLRITPVVGTVATLLIIFMLVDPPRGQAEGSKMEATSYAEDLKSLVKNPSYILSTAGSTAVAFVAGALAWWGPKFIALGKAVHLHDNTVDMGQVSFVFGLLAMIAGITGVPLGSFAGQRLRVRFPRADPLVCAFGLFMSTPLMLGVLLMAGVNTDATFVLAFFGQVFLNLNWAIVADILLYVVVPTRRATAAAFQILISHALGDAGSPYFIGQVSEALKPYFNTSSEILVDANGSLGNSSQLISTPMPPLSGNCSNSTLNLDDYVPLQWSLTMCIIVQMLGGLFFLATAVFLVRDKEKADRTVATDPKAVLVSSYDAIELNDSPSKDSGVGSEQNCEEIEALTGGERTPDSDSGLILARDT
ncbi:hypothetical protein QYM36_001956 [Artemia franciscana]|uniref:Major facilitator superfamily (MFS) profile domain-containing protein n=1 Tax=Artemia franciscana TaxID=6661 RepID=A0AA88LAP8_ARTSF|nr:hypothetical protein QYM36_001956 [Artemia franciscana]